MKMDVFKIMRILRDTQFAYSICADHMPSLPMIPASFKLSLSVTGISRL